MLNAEPKATVRAEARPAEKGRPWGPREGARGRSMVVGHTGQRDICPGVSEPQRWEDLVRGAASLGDEAQAGGGGHSRRGGQETGSMQGQGPTK